MSSYPKSMQYYLNRISNFSRQKYKIMTMAQTLFNPNDQIVFTLPEGLVDLTTLTLHGKLTTTASGGTTPSTYAPPIEAMIDSIYIDVGGVGIQTSFTNYNQLFNIFRDFQMVDKKALRGILQNDANPSTTSTNYLLSSSPFAVQSWLGLLGSVKQLDTTLIPPVKVYIRLASTACLSLAGAPTTYSFNWKDVYASVDVLDISDGIYYNAVASKLASSPIEIPFDNYATVIGSSGTMTQSHRFSTSTDCLESVIATMLSTLYTDNAHNTTTALSTYFTRKGDAISSSQFLVNGVPYPSYPQDNSVGEPFVQTSQTLGIANDVTTQTNANMNTLTAFNTHFWTHAISFGVPYSIDDRYVCGLSGRGNALQISFNTTGTTAQGIPICWLKQRSIMRIGSGKQVELVL